MSEHYFSTHPSGEFTRKELEVLLAGAPRRVCTAGGVFSPDHLDRGTEVLLRAIEQLRDETLPEEAADQSPILDLGCGWGPIALSAALTAPQRTVWAIDVNERSRALTAENVSRLGLTNVRVSSPDEVPADIQFGEIHSNPPIRVGKAILHDILRSWIPRLAPGGVAYLVVAKHLGAESLQRWITAQFPELHVSRAARDRGFHVIAARSE